MNCVTLQVIKRPTFALLSHSQLIIKKMSSKEVKGNWNEKKGKLKQKFAILTDNDLMYDEGSKEEMFGKLQIILGKSKEELQKIFSSL
jgi:uncharacterized protein YjbJ (UPF0337 family)